MPKLESSQSHYAWHSLSVDSVLQELQAKSNGLTGVEAESRLKIYGVYP